MGGRGRGRYQASQPKGKGLGAGTARAVPKDSVVHVDILRAYPSEDGAILLHRQGARSDSQLLDKQFLLQLLTRESHELLNRPEKGLSMLCGSMAHGLVALQRVDTTLCQNDRRTLVTALESLSSACGALDTTKKRSRPLKSSVQQSNKCSRM